jgi:DNA-binding transcriptional MerR regulator
MDAPDSTASRRPAKSEAAFRTISEVSEDLDVPQHVLRFWESKFAQIKPLKRGGGRRYYRPEDVVLLGHIRDLLYRDGYTIRGVQKLLREPGARGRMEAGEGAETPQPKPLEASAEPPEEPSAGRGEALREVVGELLELRRLLADARRK